MVDKAFHDFMNEIFGRNQFMKFKHDFLCDYLELRGTFERNKRKFNPQKKQNVAIMIPQSIHETLDTDDSIEGSLSRSRYGHCVVYKHGKLLIPSEIFGTFYKDVTKAIVSCVAKVTEKVKFRNIETVLLVGGFSLSAVIEGELRESFPKKNFISLVDEEAAVLKGAVHYGCNPTFVSSRVCSLTYGIDVFRDYDAAKHGSRKKEQRRGKSVVLNCFEKIFTINDIIKIGETRFIGVCDTYRHTEAVKFRSHDKTIRIYSSTKTDPMYVDERESRLHGILSVSPPGGRWDEEVEGQVGMTLGGTEIEVKYRDLKSNHMAKVNVDFMTGESKCFQQQYQ